MLFVNFPLLGHHGEERLRIRLLVAGEEDFCVPPAPAAATSVFSRVSRTACRWRIDERPARNWAGRSSFAYPKPCRETRSHSATIV